MMKLIPPPACAGNDIWMLHLGAQALVIDPDDAAAVQAAPDAQGPGLAAILVTHPHAALQARADAASDGYPSLLRLASLPADTPRRRPRRAHRVGAANRDIGAHAPRGAAFRAHLRPDLPSTIVSASRIAPILSCNAAAAGTQARERPATGEGPVATFAVIRA